MPLPFETERLILRSFQEADIPGFAQYRSDPQIARYQGWDTPFTESQAGRFIEEMKGLKPGTPGEWYQIAIQLKAGSNLAGDCAYCVLLDDPQQAEIGFTLASAYQGQGYATEAVKCLLDYLFLDLNLHRVRAITDADNLPSARLLERIGMRREAHFIENIWFKGRWGNEFWFGIFQKEWRLNTKGKR